MNLPRFSQNESLPKNDHSSDICLNLPEMGVETRKRKGSVGCSTVINFDP